MSYKNTFIKISEDSEVTSAVTPPEKQQAYYSFN